LPTKAKTLMTIPIKRSHSVSTVYKLCLALEIIALQNGAAFLHQENAEATCLVLPFIRPVVTDSTAFTEGTSEFPFLSFFGHGRHTVHRASDTVASMVTNNEINLHYLPIR